MQDQVLKALDTFRQTMKAIMHDSVEPGLSVELEAATDTLEEAVLDIDKKAVDLIVKYIREDAADQEDFNKIICEIRKQDNFDDTELLKVLMEERGPDAIAEILAKQGYLCVKLESMDHTTKLREFICTEIYPDYNEQKKFLASRI